MSAPTTPHTPLTHTPLTAVPRPRSRRRGLVALAVACALMAGSVSLTVGAAPAQALPASSEELALHQMLNSMRSSYGLPQLNWDDNLAATSRNWSAYMGSIDRLVHDPNLAASLTWAVPGWSRGGENVGVGYTPQGLHNAFASSAAHFTNMVGDYNRVGIGTVWANGKLFVTVRFAKGPTTGGGSWPVGSFDQAAQTGDGKASVAGWALDPDTTAIIDVHVYVDGRWVSQARASGIRNDVAAAFPHYGAERGWQLNLSGLSIGTHTVCVYGINAPGTPGSNPLLQCRSLAIKQLSSPFGSMDSVIHNGPGTLLVQGWTIDPDTSASIDVDVLVDGKLAGAGTANVYRPDVGRAYPGKGNYHGYRVTASGVLGGTRQICVRGRNASGTPGATQTIACTYVTMPSSPIGSVDSASNPSSGKLRVSGWSFDADSAATIDVHVYVDGRWGGATTANKSRTDVGGVYPAWGTSRGYSLDLTVSKGSHRVCSYGINAPGTPGTNPLLGCRTVTVG